MDSIVECIFFMCSYIFLVLIKLGVVCFYGYKIIKEVIVVINDKDWRGNIEVREVIDCYMVGFEKIFFK